MQNIYQDEVAWKNIAVSATFCNEIIFFRVFNVIAVSFFSMMYFSFRIVTGEKCVSDILYCDYYIKWLEIMLISRKWLIEILFFLIFNVLSISFKVFFEIRYIKNESTYIFDEKEKFDRPTDSWKNFGKRFVSLNAFHTLYAVCQQTLIYFFI